MTTPDDEGCKRRAGDGCRISGNFGMALALREKSAEEPIVIHITETTVFDDHEIRERFVRSAGGGNKNVNRDATAVELRLNIPRSSLPADVKQRLVVLGGKRVTHDGVLVVVSRADESQARNRETARGRLLRLLMHASAIPKERKPTAVGPAIQRKRLVAKERRSAIKRTRAGSDDY
jgi:ribosome-associated protein